MRVLLLALCLLSLLPLPAQDGEDVGRGREAGRRAWLVATAIPDGIENPIQVLAGKELTEVLLSKRSIGDSVAAPKDGIVRVVRPKPAAELVEGEDPYITLAQARIPESVRKALIILVPAPPADAPKVFRTKVQDLAEFRGGGTLYLNLTPTEIGVKLGDATIPLKPGAVRVHNVSNLNKPTNAPVSYHFRDPEKDEWKLISASTLVLRPTRREICIFSVDARFGRIDYHGVTFPVEREP
ncbi:hypothetical protein [Haloferula sp. A504]|uniref:hypothetical protein n=1 Tax=Haloferula sp. A504 TaxID=3373601 RepID=UPI0031C48398|nr:hypothetical protein [Verrucomicrobiaceae bacterium E54]